jgi:hypothetical protein
MKPPRAFGATAKIVVVSADGPALQRMFRTRMAPLPQRGMARIREL